MKRFLYLLALVLAIFTAIAYVIGQNWQEKKEVALSEMTQSQRLSYLKGRAETADSEAQYLLGQFYEKERQDYIEAFRWYRAASSRAQHAGAMYKMGYLYLHGRGVENNMSTAIDWFRKAAAMDEPRAQYFLGVAIRDGWEKKPDLVAAYKWLWLSIRGTEQLQAEDARYNPKAALDEMDSMMSNFKKEQALQEAKEWLANKKAR